MSVLIEECADQFAEKLKRIAQIDGKIDAKK